MSKHSISFGGKLEDNSKTLAQVLIDATQHHNQGITYIQNETSDFFQSYQDLYQEALLILNGLQKQGIKLGDQVILQITKTQDFIPTLWACFLGGIIPVPLTIAPSYDLENSAVKKLENVWKFLDKPLILSDNHLITEIEKLGTYSHLKGWQCVSINTLRKTASQAHQLPTLNPQDPALLLFTSGSTGLPKGVMLTHDNILSMSAGTVAMNGFTPQEVTLNWMPLDHVGAIVFLGIMAVDLACHQIHVPMELILRSPLKWLDLIQKYKVSISWAPNFAFSLINQQAQALEKTSYNLSSMKFLVNAGEQVSVKTIRLFLEILEKHQLPNLAIKPAFGMTESCSGITWSTGLSWDQLTEENSFVSLGKPIPGATIRIVDQENNPLPEGEIGRLQMRGNSVTKGYYQNQELNREVFEQGWFTTGDLGYLFNGELFITGREKQEIIINGINYFAHEIETAIEELEGVNVSYTAAFAVFDQNLETDLLVITFSPQSDQFQERVKVVKKIRTHLTQKIGISPAYIIPLEIDLVPKTSIGKVQKSQLKKQFEQGLFHNCIQEINQYLETERQKNQTLPQSDHERQIATVWGEVLQLNSVGLHDNFFELGGHSLHLIRVQNQLEKLFNCQLSIAEMFKNPTVATLARFLSQESNTTQIIEQKSRLRAKNRTSGHLESHDIAIIGMAGQFPGADNLTTFWENLKNGVETISFFSDEELLESGVSPELFNQPNYVKARPILDRVEYFDSEFFGYTDREAELLDPQQRLLLECSWECLENAGYNPHIYQGSIGIFAGASMNTYLMNNCYPNRGQLDSNDELQPFTLDSMGGFQTMVANDKDYLTTRISYKLNLQGPSVNIQTACSTGLVVAHLACQSLISGESDMALAGAASINSPQKIGYLYQEGLIVSPDGHCRAFDAQAKGTIFGSGVGVVLLKRLSDALADRDHIYAVIKGSAINNDGGTKLGFTAPGGEGQISAALEALAVAGVEPNTIGFVEAHGTGTPLGDPIEVDALAKVYQGGNSEQCALGSVKTNIGHMQIASGIAGLIKATLALKHQTIAPTLHFQTPNPQINFAQTPFYINTKAKPWVTQGEKSPRRAGVNSLGIGGVNAHVILEEAPPIMAEENQSKRPYHLLTLSARTETALKELGSRYRDFLENQPEGDLCDVVFTANTGRVHFSHRLALTGSKYTDLIEQLQQFEKGYDSIINGKVDEKKPPKIAFLFTGQGSQYGGMASELYQTQPTFKQTLDQGETYYQKLTGKSLLNVIFAQGDDTLTQTAHTQPALFLIEVALAQLWHSWGIKPAAILGHSLGEYSAACFAGVFDLENGLKLVTNRGNLMGKLPQNQGAMMAVFLDQKSVIKECEKQGIKVAIAAINSAQHTVISGEKYLIEKLFDHFTNLGIKVRQLKVSHGFHSPLVEPMVTEFKAILEEISFSKPHIPLISNLTGEVANESIMSVDYWIQHLLNTVQFHQGVLSLQALGCDTFIEIGPQPVLSAIVQSSLSSSEPLTLPSLRSGFSDWQVLLESLGKLYVRGVDIDWFSFEKDYHSRRCPLPTYPFEKRQHWIPLKTSSTTVAKESNLVKMLSQKESDNLIKTLLKTGNYSEDEQETVSALVQQLIKLHHQDPGKSNFAELLYQVAWLPSGLGNGKLHNLTTLKTDLEAYLEPQLQSPELTGVDLAFCEMEKLTADFIIKALKDLKLFEINTFLSVFQQKIKVEHQGLWNHCIDILAKNGILEKQNSGWKIIKDSANSNPDLALEHLINHYPNAKIELSLFWRVSTNLAAILTGEIPPLSILFSEEIGAKDFYKNTSWAKILNQTISKTVELLLSNADTSRPLRILEIGAGTGATTQQVLKACHSHPIHYTFTDVSLVFLETAKEIFSDCSTIEYKVLDIEKDPKLQGFDSGDYDLIIAANVLHSTASLQEETLPNIQSLLRRGGHLLLLELTHQSNWIDLIFGVTQGWWRFSDYDLRPNHPIITASTWESILLKSGFSQVKSVSPDQKIDKALFQQSIIVAQNQESVNHLGKNWLIFTDIKPETNAFPLALQKQILENYESCQIIYQSNKNTELSSFEYALNGHQLEQLEEWFSLNPQPDQIIYLVNNDQENQPESILLNRCNYLLNLLKALQKIPNSPKLFLVTQGGQTFNSQKPTFLAQSPLWAMGRVIALENPHLWGGMIDLDPDVNINQKTEELIRGLTQIGDEDHLILRQSQSYVARLLPQKSLETKPLEMRSNSTYLITGGIGHLGLELAQHLVNLGAKHLILTTRRPFSSRSRWDSETELMEISQTLRKLEQKGASIQVICADVGNFEAMESIFSQIEKSPYPLRGVFHLAGISGRQAELKDCTFEDLEAIFQAKVKGSWNLHQLSLGIELDYFVLFSSAGAIWGAKEQGLYDTVSHFMDGLAYVRHLQGLRATTLNWALLAGNGIVSQEYEDWLKQIGMREIDLDTAFSAMDAIIASNQTQVLIADVDWVRFKKIYQFKGDKPLLKNLGLGETPIKPVPKSPSVRYLLEEISLGERREYLLEYVGKQVRIILGIKGMPDPEQGLIEMGIDSLSSIELKNRLEKGLEVTLSTSLVFDFPNIRRLVDYLFEHIFGEQIQKPAQKMIDLSEVQQEIDEDLILQELADLEAFLRD